jgi:hypothetical protein
MLATRCLRFWAGVALGLAILLAACAPQTAPAEGPTETSGSLPVSTQPASPTPEGKPTTLPASPTPQPALPASPTATPASPTAAPLASPSPIRLTPAMPVVPLPGAPQPAPTSAQGPVTGEVPQELLDAIFGDAEERTGVDRAQFTLLRAEAVVWRDGSLGCPQPGMMYTQALAPGYWVVLEAGGRELDYHASTGWHFFLCESPLPRQEPLPGGEGQ